MTHPANLDNPYNEAFIQNQASVVKSGMDCLQHTLHWVNEYNKLKGEYEDIKAENQKLMAENQKLNRSFFNRFRSKSTKTENKLGGGRKSNKRKTRTSLQNNR